MKHHQQFELLIGGSPLQLAEQPSLRATCTAGPDSENGSEKHSGLQLKWVASRTADREEHRRVFQGPAGQILVDSRLISLALPPDYTRKHENDLRKRYNCSTPKHAGTCTFNLRHLPLRVPENQCCMAFTRSLENDPDIITAEPLLIQHLAPRSGFNHLDPLSPWQWSHDRANLRAAHTLATGNGVRILVLDQGFDPTHADLAANLHAHRPSYRETVDGQLLVSTRPADLPNHPHGTFVAGVLAADDNLVGIRGAAPDASLQLAAISESGTQRQLAIAIDDALNHNEPPHIISCSLGPNQGGWPLQHILRDAIEFAARHARGGRGVPIFWAVSNGFEPIALDRICSHPDVIAVGSSNAYDQTNGSAYGPELDFLAPGVNVLGTQSPDTHGYNTGTSFAAPLAAGIAALLLQQRPNATANQLRTWLHQSARPGWSPNFYGAGILNAAQALHIS